MTGVKTFLLGLSAYEVGLKIVSQNACNVLA